MEEEMAEGTAAATERRAFSGPFFVRRSRGQSPSIESVPS